MKVGVAASTFHFLVGWVGEMVDENFFGECEWTTEALATKSHTLGKGGVHLVDQLLRGSCGHCHDDS